VLCGRTRTRLSEVWHRARTMSLRQRSAAASEAKPLQTD
jgi:hypothetical protein